MKKKIILLAIIVIIILGGVSCFWLINKEKITTPLPIPEKEEGLRSEFGIDKNINEKTIDKYLNRIQSKRCKSKPHDFIITPKYDGVSLRVYIYSNKVLVMNRNEIN